MIDAPRYSGLRDYLNVLRANWFAILVVAAVGGVVALGLSLRKDAHYVATARMAFEDDTRQLAVLGFSSNDDVSADQLPIVRAQAIADEDVARAVQAVLSSPLSPAALAAKVGTSVDQSTGLVTVTVTDADPGQAVRVVNAFAREDSQLVNDQARQSFATAAALVRKRIRKLGHNTEDNALRRVLSDQLARSVFLQTSTEPARVVRSAAGAAKVAESPVHNALLGVALGLLLGVAAAFVRDALDRRLRGVPEIETALGLPVLGRVPGSALGHPVAPSDSADERSVTAVEVFRIVRQNLERLGNAPIGIVAVTSATGSEGKSTVAASLAAAAAAKGQRTLLLEADLRRPSLGERFTADRAPGLTDYLLGDADALALLQPVQPRPGSGKRQAERAWPEELRCLTAGTPTSRPAELLASPRFGVLLGELRPEFDLVVIDCSPLLPVADTLEILPLVDGVVLCVRANQTTAEQAGAARTALDHTADRPVGVVVTGLAARDMAQYVGSYRFETPAASVG